MIQSEEFMLKSNHDGLELGVSVRIPEHPVGILQLVHGMSEHRERYHDFMDYAAKHGLVTIIHDHRGHGASVKTNDDYGYFYQNGINGIIDDVYQVTTYIRQRFPDLPLTLFGHSMGSLVVRCYTKIHDDAIDGLIVCGSPSKRFGSRLGLLMIRTLKLFYGDHHRSKFIDHLAVGGHSQKFSEDGSPSSWIVSDPAVVAAYDADERDGFVFTLNGFEVLFQLLGRTYSRSGWQVHHPDLPILFIAGAEDPCILSHADFAKAVNFMRDRGYTDVKSKLYPKMRHEILNEIDKDIVWQDVIAATQKLSYPLVAPFLPC